MVSKKRGERAIVVKRTLAALLAALTLFDLSGCGPGEKEGPSASPPPETAAFAAFLAGEATAQVDDGFRADLKFLDDFPAEDAGEFSLRDLTQMVRDADTWDIGFQDLKVFYAQPETLSGRQMLALEYVDTLDGQTFTAYLILGDYDGQVRLTYATDSYYRSFTELDQNLIFSGHYSRGAGHEFDWLGYIDDTGHYRSVYQLESLYYQWVALYAFDVFGTDAEWAEECTCCILTAEDGVFYQLDVGEGADPEKVALLREYLAGQGMTEIDSVADRVAQLKAERGIGEAAPFEDWTPLEPEGWIGEKGLAISGSTG